MAWDSQNDTLLVTNDGGLYFHTKPRDGQSGRAQSAEGQVSPSWESQRKEREEQQEKILHGAGRSVEEGSDDHVTRGAAEAGLWVSPAGDLPIMEFIFAHLDSRLQVRTKPSPCPLLVPLAFPVQPLLCGL